MLPLLTKYVAPLLCPSVGVKPNTWKSWVLESFGTPECLELDSKVQNTSHWVFLVSLERSWNVDIENALALTIRTFAAQVMGKRRARSQTSSFDSRPLKVENRCLPDVRFGSAIRRWKDLDKGYNFGSDLVAIQLCSRELWQFKVPEVPPWQNRDSISGVPGICAIWMPAPWRAAENTIGSKVVAYSPSLGCGESCVSKCTW
jgi:hypothetical protein